MKTIKPLILLMILFVYVSCEKTVTNVDLPRQDKKLVLHSYISPEDTIIKVHVSHSYPIWEAYDGSFGEVVKNAQVIIKSENTTAIIPFVEQENAYIIGTDVFPILAGRTYELHVSTPDGKNVEASCTVPSDINQNIQLLSIDTALNDWGGKIIRFKVRFTDMPGVGHYYRLGGMLHYLDMYWSGQDTLSEELYPRYNATYFSDVYNDGMSYLSELNYWIYDETNWLVFVAVDLMLLTTDKHYYNYHLSLSNYIGEDPFSEPTIVYTNVNRGLGVFGAYRKFNKYIQID